jgi:hypothetical protein
MEKEKIKYINQYSVDFISQVMTDKEPCDIMQKHGIELYIVLVILHQPVAPKNLS